jgi:hypothetical protein
VPDEWDDTHWIAQWRTEPEIDAQRQKELAKCRARPAEREKEVYPFSGIHLNRADVEWLLATYDYNNWLPSPEASPRVMLSGADLRGTRLTGIDLRSAHLERANLSRTLLERDDLAGARLEGADLQKQIERLQGLMQDAQTI